MTRVEPDAPIRVLTAGFAHSKITPLPGAPLAGFSARTSKSVGVHDDLCARALTLSDGERSLAIVSLDLMAVSAKFVDQVRSEISAATGLKPEAIMIAATHTHGGPVTTPSYPPEEQVIDLRYMAQLQVNIVTAVAAAWKNRFPAQIGIGTARARGIGGNRHRLNGATDPELGLVKIADLDGHTRAVCVNYACHPTILGPNNLHVTADFPGFVVSRIAEHLGDDGFAMFLNGAAGNISVGRSPGATALGIAGPGRTFERAEEIGHELADLAIQTLPQIDTNDKCSLDFATRNLELELRPLPTPEEAELEIRRARELLDKRKSEGATTEEIQRAQLDLLYANLAEYEARRRIPGQQSERVEIQCLRIGSASLLGMPLEPFTEIGLELKRAATLQLFIVGLANGYLGYLPSSDASEEHAYETMAARFVPGSDRTLVAQATELEREVSKPASQRRMHS